MEDSPYPFTASGSDDETRRHNNLRRDILTSLLEVDQSIKGLEHNLVGKIQQIEERLPQAEGAVRETARRCEFDPAATTEWALKILQDNIAPLASHLSGIQAALKALPAPGAGEDLAPALERQLAPLRETLAALKEDVGRVRSSLADLEVSSQTSEATAVPLQETLQGLAQESRGIQSRLAEIEKASASLRGEFSPLRELLLVIHDETLKDPLPAIQKGLAPLKEMLASIKQEAERLRNIQEQGVVARDATQGLAKTLAALTSGLEALHGRLSRSQDAMAPLGQDLGDLKESVVDLREGVNLVRDTVEGGARRMVAESKEAIAPVQEEMRKMSESLRLVQETLPELKEAVAPLQETTTRGAESARTAAEGMVSLRADLEALRAGFDASRTTISSLPDELRRFRETALDAQDRLSGLKEAVAPLKDLVSQSAAASQSGASALAALREETRAIPGALRTAREEMEAALRRQGEEHSQLLREIGGKMLEEISLLLVETRRTPQSPEALTGLSREIAEIRSAQKEAQKALGRLRDLLEQNPSAELALSAIQQIQEQNDGTAKQLSRLEEVVQRGETEIQRMKDSHRSVVQAFESQRQLASEEEERVRQRAAQEHNNRGVLLYYRGALEGAEASFRKAVDVLPAYAEAWNNLGLVLSRQGKPDDAAAAFQKAIEIDPQMGEVYNNLGFLYHTSLQYDKALEMFNQALQSSSDSAVAYTNLGNTYYKLNRHAQAISAWKRAVELDPLNENARRCLRMYQQENS